MAEGDGNGDGGNSDTTAPPPLGVATAVTAGNFFSSNALDAGIQWGEAPITITIPVYFIPTAKWYGTLLGRAVEIVARVAVRFRDLWLRAEYDLPSCPRRAGVPGLSRTLVRIGGRWLREDAVLAMADERVAELLRWEGARPECLGDDAVLRVVLRLRRWYERRERALDRVAVVE